MGKERSMVEGRERRVGDASWDRAEMEEGMMRL